MTTARKTRDTRNFEVIKTTKKVNKRLDRLCALALLITGTAVSFFEKDFSVLIIFLLVSAPLMFGKEKYVSL